MTELITFPDVEAVLVTHLGGALSVPASTKIPSPRPQKFLRLRQVGGSRRDLVTESVMVTFEAWADTETNAGDLGRLAHAHVFALPDTDVEGAVFRRVQETGGLQNYPDPETGAARYTFTVLLDTKGVSTG